MSFIPVKERNPELKYAGLLDKGEEYLKSILTKYGFEWECNHAPRQVLRDKDGKFAYLGNIKNTFHRYVLLARSYVYGMYVGAGLDVLQWVARAGVPLLIYIDGAEKIYLFHLDEIDQVKKVSYRHGKTYYDFPITIGKNFESILRQWDQYRQFKLEDFSEL